MARPSARARAKRSRAGTQVPFDLARRTLGAGAQEEIAGRRLIVSAPQQWSYAVVIPANSAVTGNKRLRVTLKLRVREGALLVGVMTRGEQLFYNEVPVEAGGWQEIDVETPPLNDLGPLIIRNASPDGASRFEYAVVGSKPAAQAPMHGSAALTAERAVAAMQELARMSREQGTLLDSARGLLIEAARELLTPYRALLFDAGEFTRPDTFASINDDVLCAFAEGLAVLRPLGFCPGWHFDPRATSTEFAVQLRGTLWAAIAARLPERRIRVPWHGETALGLRFGSDLSLAIYVGGAFEPNEFTVLDRILEPGGTFIDIGANEGVYSLYAAARVGRKGRVVAVEPSPREIASLRANLSLNPRLHVSVVEAAVAETNGWADFHVAEFAHAGQNALASLATGAIPIVEKRAVPTVALDTLVERLPGGKVDIVKIDVEGAELGVLRGAAETLRKSRPVFLLEVAREGEAPDPKLLSLLEEAKYAVSVIDDPSGSVLPIEDVPEDRAFNIVAIPREQRSRVMPLLRRDRD